MNFEKNISKPKLEVLKKYHNDNIEVLSDGFYFTQLNVRFIAKGTEFYMKLPLKFKFGKSKINGSVNQTKIYILSLMVAVLISSLMYVVRIDFKAAIIFGGIGGLISYLMFRKNVKSSLNYFYKSLLKFLVLGYFISNSFSSFSQTNNDSIIYYKPVFVNQCTGEVIAYVKPNEDDSTVSLSKWDICFVRNCLIYKYDINFNTDSVNVPKLAIRYCTSHCSDYYYCDSKANGYLEDYYHNGQLRIKGTFKNGQPIDTVFIFYEKGQLKKIEIPQEYNKKHILTYFENGILKEDYNQVRGEIIQYYESGEIKETFLKKDNYETKVYFESGKLKFSSKVKSEKEFYENRKLKEHLYKKELWKLERMLHPKDYPYYSSRFFNHYWLSFNTKGKRIRKIIFDETDFNYDFESQNNLDKIENQNIESVLFYKNGKKYKLIEFDYTEKAHFLYEYVKHKKVLISKVERITVKELIKQIDKEIE